MFGRTIQGSHCASYSSFPPFPSSCSPQTPLAVKKQWRPEMCLLCAMVSGLTMWILHGLRPLHVPGLRPPLSCLCVWNTSGSLVNIRDPPLTETGKIQALKTGISIKNHSGGGAPVIIFTSPFLRCLQTASAIASGLGNPPVRIEPGLSEFLDIKW